MPDADGDLAELRRRVYSPDATEEDRRRYHDAVAEEAAGARSVAAPADTAEHDPAPAPAATARRRRRLIAGAVVAAAVVVVAVVVAVLPHGTAPAGPAPQELPVTADDRSTFINALVIGTDAGIAAYLLTHRYPVELRTAVPSDVTEQRGVGPADIVLARGAAQNGGIVVDGRTGQTFVAGHGRVTVLLVVAQGADVGWTLETGSGATARPAGQRGGFQAAGSLTSATIPYTSGPPDHLRVDVPAGVPWGVAAVYTN